MDAFGGGSGFHQSGDLLMQRLEVDFELQPVTLKFKDPGMETRFENYLTLRARQYHDGMWLLRAWLVMSRAVHELTRGSRLSVLEVYLNCVFVLLVAAAYGVSRRVSRFGEGTQTWQLLVLGLAFVHATQLAVSFTHYPEHGSRRWFRYYYLGLDYAIDATMFSLLFGLRQPGAALALAINFAALVTCLRVDAPPASKENAGVPGIVDGLVFAVGLFACARAQEKASRAAFARDMRHDIRHSIDLRALQQPFSAGNLSAWLRAFANRSSGNANVQPHVGDPRQSTNNFSPNQSSSSFRASSSSATTSSRGDDHATRGQQHPRVLTVHNPDELRMGHADVADPEAGSGGGTLLAASRSDGGLVEMTTERRRRRQGQDGDDFSAAEGQDDDGKVLSADAAGALAPKKSASEPLGPTSKENVEVDVSDGAAIVADGGRTPLHSKTTAAAEKEEGAVASKRSYPPPPPPSETMRRFETLQNWEIDYDRLRVVRKIGAGSAGHVYKGEYIGAVVAIKQLYSTFIDPSNLDEFSREVTLLHKLKHPHVLTFYGIARRDVYCYIVTEFCPYALDAILSGKPGNESDKAPPRLSVSRRVRIAHEVSLALAYLHAERVLHHDLKPGNILLNSDFVARVSDFGLSQLVARDSDVAAAGSFSSSSAAHHHHHHPDFRGSAASARAQAAAFPPPQKKPPPAQPLGGTATFSAPEITLGTVRPGFHALCKLDVFSFGIVLAAVFAPNGDPYYFYVTGDRGTVKTGSDHLKHAAGQTHKHENDIRLAVASKKLRPRVPAALPAEIRPLMERCWAHNPDERPSFSDISRDLRAYLVKKTELENTTPTHLPVGPLAL
eukprot:CAMPEP_0118905194 /NCGR_PEP_ID=MMETSP1166-20130328/9325_1 /TAXON_ID=1104430 /ORGANISM="Chrysoreinhardia sp, Strain CCMP3193" /LENGTH=840 /DNA_ID=CAMNT_0006844463 /DNA_START=172 /DNA_END=2694 /DNA_ORIENTATION=+